jgi:hypothetical protein
LRLSHLYTGNNPDWQDYRGRSDAEKSRFDDWRTCIDNLTTLVEEALAADRVAVVRPLRLSRRMGSIHKDTIKELKSVESGGPLAWTEILRVCDRGLYTRLAAEAQGKDLPADHERPDRIGSRTIELFPTNAAYLRIRGGAVGIGDSIHHARVYASHWIR